MKHKIDKYFKEKLESPQAPPESAWGNIQKHLPKKEEKRRIVPFFLRLSGIAAVLLLMVGFGYWLGTQNQEHVESSGFATYPNGNPGDSASETFNSATGSNSEINTSNQIFNEKSDLNPISNSAETPFVSNYRQNNFSYENSELNNLNDEFNSKFSKFSKEITQEMTFGTNLDLEPLWNDPQISPKISLLPIIINPEESQANDSEYFLALNEKPSKEKENVKKKKKQIDFDRFHISGFASPLAFNTFVGNSMLADEMSEYETENNITLAYGVKAAYSLTPKLKVRTGISVIGFEQITNDVPLAAEITGREEFSSVDRTNNIQYTGNVVIDNNSVATSLIEMELTGKIGTGDMQQQTSYIEIPLEAELSLFETNSIGISATGGGSTWLLSKNKIYVHTDDYTQELGKANNLNKVSFSANAGLKFDLNLTDNVKLNIEPNFRYLINPVNNIEKYNPYTVGVNAGVSVSLK